MNLLRSGILVTLTLSTTVTVLLMRWSRKSSEESYFPSTVVFITELCKFTLCLLALFWAHGFLGGCQVFSKEIVQNVRETSRLILPAGLYALQNNLLYLALTYLDSATYQVTYQLKILTTALFSVVLLRRRLKLMQWTSLVLLSIGVMLVQVQNAKHNLKSQALNATMESPSLQVASAELRNHQAERLFGVSCVLGACVTSAISGVYFELLVKNSAQKSVIIRNLQMGIISIFMTFLAVIWDDFKGKGFFFGYNNITVAIISLQSLGGLLVAAVMKFADNILKGFSTSISIIICAIISRLFLEDEAQNDPSLVFFFGTFLVVSSSLLYAIATSDEKVTSPRSVQKC